ASNTSLTTDAWTGTNSGAAYTLVGGTRLSVLGNGNVGIGTTTPGYPLEISSDGTPLTIDATTYGSLADFRGKTTYNGHGLDIFSGTAATGFQTTFSGDDLIFGTRVAPNNLERMRITSTGNVGIGTATVGYPLTVGVADGQFQVTPGATYIKGSSTGGWAYGYRFRGSGDTAGGGLWVNGTTDTLNYYTIGSAYNVGLSVSNSTGYVGVGITTPSYPLHVVGDSYITSNLGVGVVPSSNIGVYSSIGLANTSNQNAIRGEATGITSTAAGTYYNMGGVLTGKDTISAGITNSGYIMGADISSYAAGTGTIAATYGARIDTGTITNAANITNSYGAMIRILNQGSGTITNSYGVNITTDDYTGTIGTAYGVYVNDLVANTGYGIYQAGTNDTNYFAGNVGIGVTSPTSGKLQIDGVASNALYLSTTNDYQVSLNSSDAWAGIMFNDSGATNDYIWYNGTNGTFAFGGGGSSVAGKKLHVDGGMTIGANYDATAMATNGLSVEGLITATSGLTSNGTLTVGANQNFVMSSGTGTSTQTFTGTTTVAHTITANSLTTGSALDINTTNTATTNTPLSAISFDITNAQSTIANSSITGLAVNFTNNPSIAGNTGSAVRIQNQATSNVTDNAVSALLLLDNADTTTLGTTVVTDAIKITNSGGSNFTNFLNTPTINISAAGAISGVTTIATSGTINSQTISSAASFTGTVNAVTGYKVNGAATLGNVLRGDGTNFVSATLSGGDITGAALTKTDDTNVTLTLGGSPTTALLRATSITVGWTGTLSVARGGTGVGTFTTNGVLYGNGTTNILATAQGAANTVLVANAGAPSFSSAITVGTSVTSPSLVATTAVTTPSIVTAAGALTVTPAAGSNLNVNLSGTGDFAVSTNQFYVDSSTGNVGIGTTAPAARLHLDGLNSLIYTEPSSDNGQLSGLKMLSSPGVVVSGITTNSLTGEVAVGSLDSGYYTALYGGATEKVRISTNGNVGVGTTNPTAVLHLKAGTAAANTAPLKFTSGPLLSIPEAGAVEFLNDAYYGTITTGAARKTFAFLESPVFTGTVTIPTPFTLGATSVTTTGTQLNYLNAATGTTGTTSSNLVFSTSPTLVTPALGAATYTTLSGGNITDSALTPTRVVFAGTAGLLVDDADLTFITDTLTSTKVVAPTSVSTPSLISTGALTVTPASGSDLNVNLSTTGDFVVNTNQLFVDTSAAMVGIGTATPNAALDIYNGAILNSGSAINYYRNVASYNNSVRSVTGTMQITLPQGWTNTMMTMVIKGYDYSSVSAWEVHVSGYNYAAGPAWGNYEAEIIGSAPFSQVRLAYDTSTSKVVVLLGTTGTVWAYPKVEVTEFAAGHSNISNWGTGWTIAPVISEATITNIYTPVIPTYLTTGGNFGIGDTSPAALLTVGSGDLFQVNSSGAIAAAQGIT
ncbi:MAG: beta strand repeat-containing protein, partial [Candidatus Doudnabacteria bacterium]